MSKKLRNLVYAATGIDIGFDSAPVDINAQIAVAALLVVAANSDGSIDSKETIKMVAALCTRFSLTSTVALDLITRAVDDQSTPGGASGLIDELNQRLTLKQKEELVLMLLEVIAADGEKEASEIAMLDQTVRALNISDGRLASIYKRYFERRRSAGKQG